MNGLHFEKISQFDRRQEPLGVRISLTFSEPTAGRQGVALRRWYILGVLALLIGCAKMPAARPAGTPAVDAAGLYAAFCANCHGRDLKGGMASSLADGVWVFGGDEASLYRSIAQGIEQDGMPAFAAGLDTVQIAALVAYIRAAGLERVK